ncbi:MAG: DUF354 domain-containing protein [Anaerolineae bacterium]|nr:DUF354 domain-containing protein [Anaerolineae bacterium]
MSNGPLRLLVDVEHPAHVHLFRNARRIWLNRGHQVTITIRDKDLTGRLLDLYGFAYVVASAPRRGTLGLAIELLEHDWHVLRATVSSGSQLLLGTSVSVAHVAWLIGARSIVFNEDDAEVARAFTRLAYPLAHVIVTPACLNENYGNRHIKYEGYQKLAYLHPNVFSPNPEVLPRLGVQPGEPYFLIRLVSLQAAHDKGERGLSPTLCRRLIRTLSKHGRVFITSESPLSAEFESYRVPVAPTEIHNVLYYATMFVSDSQSMTVEAAVLGTPAIRCNTFARRVSVLQELEHKYDLTYGFLPEQEEEMFAKISELLNKPNLREEWQQKRARMLADKIDVTAWMVEFVERYAGNLR